MRPGLFVNRHPDVAPNFYTPETARLRAAVRERVRRFFAGRNVLEVETPVLSRGCSTDAHIDVFATQFQPEGVAPGSGGIALYLQTSPEMHMKRLLCQGFTDIFQISRVFRNGEAGRLHNPEFSMLEWYRRGFSMEQLVDEVAALCGTLLGERPVVLKSYQQAFVDAVGIDPLACTLADVRALCNRRAVEPPPLGDLTDGLQFVMSQLVEPTLPADSFVFVHGFPAEQAVLAVLDEKDPRTARRFELFHHGLELANGWQELADWQENERRLTEENVKRRARGRPALPVDQRFIAALKQGLPACSGVALGLDRVIMLAAGALSVGESLAFPWGDC
jgi:elongation factor P--(R)-beta-lysine ligase